MINLINRVTLVLFAAFVFSLTALAETKNDKISYNLRFEPLRLIYSTLDVVLDIKVTENWTMGFEAGYSKYQNWPQIYVVTSIVGFRANWYKNSTFSDGLYASPFIRYADVKIDAVAGSVTEGRNYSNVLGCFFGYSWYWDNFNILVGISPFGYSQPSTLVVKQQNGNVYGIRDRLLEATGELTLGWRF